MAKFVHSEEKVIGIDEPIILENNTGASFDVGVGIVFRKSGLYRVSVDGKHTSVEIEPERKKGKWIDNTFCSKCGWIHEVEPGFIGSVEQFNFCPDCGCQMREGEEE